VPPKETSVFPKLATVQLFLFKFHPFWCSKVREPLCLAHVDPGIVHGRKDREDVAQLTPREFELGLTRIDLLLMPVPRPLDAVWVDGPRSKGLAGPEFLTSSQILSSRPLSFYIWYV